MPQVSQIGYCTNVHAGATFDEMWARLKQFSVPVQQRFCPDEQMGIGLWFSANSAVGVLAENQLGQFGEWLSAHKILPFTFNGFPFGDFHQEVVKHAVYQPNWGVGSRTEYTLNLIEIMNQLLPPGMYGSISTVPIAWDEPASQQVAHKRAAAEELIKVARRLANLEDEQGRRIVICLEPEPGCSFQRSHDIVQFFDEYLFPVEPDIVRRYLGVCHDTCHASVMFESQEDVLRLYREAGITVGKVQVSAAVRAPFSEMQPDELIDAVAQLKEFAEDRYLHQTVCRDVATGKMTFYEDLPALIGDGTIKEEWRQQEWRVHFHVPVYLDSFGLLKTTQSDTLECLGILAADESVCHFEVETYAWGVLPDSLKVADLALGIGKELEWTMANLNRLRG